MTIIEAISQIDDRKHNTYSQADKIIWLSKLDAMVKRLVIDTHEGGEEVTFTGYDEDTDLDTILLIPEPYDEVYLRWLEAQIDYANGEYEKYNNSAEAYNVLWQSFQNYYNRTHMPKGKRMRFF
jgi:hypothetical protein